MYNFYRGLIEDVLSLMRKHNKGYDKWDHEKAVKDFFAKHQELQATMDFLIVSEELAYLKEGGTNFFVKDLESFKAVQSVSLDALDIAPLLEANGTEVFTLTFPKGSPLHGVFVSINTEEDFFRRVKTVDPTVQCRSNRSVTDKYAVNVSYPVGRDSKFGWSSFSRVNLPLTLLNQVIHCASIEDYANLVPLDTRVGVVDLSLEEKAYQFEVLQFIVKFLVYRAVAPERFTTGSPSKEKPGRFIASAKRAATFSLPALSSNTEHYRRAHIRQLRNERFYTKEHASKPIGSRFVWVHDSVVNKRTDDQQTFESAQ